MYRAFVFYAAEWKQLFGRDVDFALEAVVAAGSSFWFCNGSISCLIHSFILV